MPSDKTIEVYETTLASLLAKHPDVNIENPKEIVRVLKVAGKKPNTIRINLASAIHFLKENGKDVTAHQKVYKELSTQILDSAKAQSVKDESHKHLSWPAIKEAVTKIDADPAIDDSQKLLVHFYTDMPVPVRGDYLGIKVLSSPPAVDEGNYLVLSPSEAYVQINEHKTASTYGALKMDIPAGLRTRLQSYVTEKRATCLWNYKNVSSLSQILGNVFHKHTGQRVTINTLRHSFITHLREGDKSLKVKDSIATMMGHSLYMQELYRRVDA